ncbi:BAG and/or AIF-MLS domain containing protein [Asbolus verrucosus]|uniref:BAG and/or AIF-MLS domain containing protein n=1 Tax=Asbolus verrucosus TaxID=1661398 RepID=A0A482WE30_ASBVE|nr:BAG and/or AIF-MLS domain containing protein [Asbolus verrucosus]
MTSPVVDTVRNIPLIVEKDVCVPMAIDDADDSGFPFDRDFDRDSRDDHLRSQLDDIAKRHPEFAEHLEGFPFRSDSLGRRSARPPRPSDESEFRRFAGRPFGSSRFERFGFPFNRDPFEDDYQRSEEHQPRPESPQHRPEQEQVAPKQTQEKQTQVPERGRRQNIQQSNTVDLGQKQEPVNDRNQRSMSAPPPDNRSRQQRFVSSINIPINRDGGMGDMGTQQSQPQTQPQQEKPANKPTERVIPIHVEGRDEPVMPKHTGPSFSQPQPERIFGHRPSQFTQFVGRESPRPFTAAPEWHHQAYAKQEPTPTEPMRQQQQKQQQQQQVPPQRPQEPQEQVPPQQPPKPVSNPIDLIQSIQKDVSELMGQVEKFSGIPRDKQYLYLDEMLTRNLIKLDNIDTQGQENIRQARKEAIKCIESCIGILEAKAAANVPQKKPSEEKMEVEAKAAEPQPAEAVLEAEELQAAEPKTEESQQPATEGKAEVDAKESENKNEEQKEEKAEVEEKMDVVAEPAVLVVEPPKENAEPKAEENKENTETKPDEEMKTVPEDNKQGDATKEASQEDSSSEDKKEKKKGKKKVVKK